MIQNKVKNLNNKYSNYYNQITKYEKKLFLLFYNYKIYKIIIIFQSQKIIRTIKNICK